MVDGYKGREAVHGLTKEFPMHPNPVFGPEKGVFDKDTKEPSSWGVAFFNKKVCNLYNNIFGDKIQSPNWDFIKRNDTADGSVSFKLLFNTLDNWESAYPPWKGAYAWTAHVSGSARKDPRELKKVAHVQMDIAVKDTRIKGSMAEVDNWIMLTYVYDKTYTAESELLQIQHLPEGLKHMKPVGIQFGLEPRQSIIFPGAVTNYQYCELGQPDETNPIICSDDEEQSFIENGELALLNGPADNPKSSCLGCHAAAGLEDFIARDNSDEERRNNFALDTNRDDPVGESGNKLTNGVWRFTLYSNQNYNRLKLDSDSRDGRETRGFRFNHQLNIAHDRYQRSRQSADK